MSEQGRHLSTKESQYSVVAAHSPSHDDAAAAADAMMKAVKGEVETIRGAVDGHDSRLDHLAVEIKVAMEELQEAVRTGTQEAQDTAKTTRPGAGQELQQDPW